MITERTIREAKAAADEYRQRGEAARLVAEGREDWPTRD